VSKEALVSGAALRQFARRVFTALGMQALDAALLADHLVWADLRGASWLGVRKLPQYVAQLRGGGASADARAAVVHDRGAFALVDAGNGFGQVVAVRAMTMAVDKARSLGVGAVAVRNTTSAGALGYYATLAAEQRMIGLAINNSPPLQTAPGGTERIIGNQAFAVGSPSGRGGPVVLDMATSAMSWVRIHEYAQRRARLPEGVALTGDGRPTVDPAEALAGMLLPMSGHRGFGLAVLWEILTGVLSGGPGFGERSRIPDADDRPPGTSMFCLAVNPEFAMPYETFVARVDGMIDRLRASRRAPGVERVTVPGERGRATAARRADEGIPVAPELAAALRKLGAELDVPWI
jgi:LDH2 family malate/lactate/ureidoglycolate dehydrogenase